MAKKHTHEEHQNHEAWAIPYGDLVTLLLAFFVVMYAISSVNEGKYRAAADSLNAAFGGPPRTTTPLQLGRNQQLGSSFDRPSLMTAAARVGPAPASMMVQARLKQTIDMPRHAASPGQAAAQGPGIVGTGAIAGSGRKGDGELVSLGRDIQTALSDLVNKKLVTLRRGRNYLEVEIQSDILFASGVAAPSPVASDTVRRLADVLRGVPNAVRVEGYTDDRPIATVQYPSNWELSSARAASIVHVLGDHGVAAARMAVVGYGEHQPIADNATAVGRNANRRVMLVILAAPQGPDTVPDAPLAVPPATTPATPPDLAPKPPTTVARADAAPGGGGPIATTGIAGAN